MTHEMKHCDRPWWKRPPVWFVAIAAAVLLGVVGTELETTSKPVATPYSTFLDQVEAGNVASVTFQGTEINGRFKRPLDGTQRDAFSTRAPDVSDPALIPALRKQRVTIDVRAPSPWTAVLTRIPWPMLVFLGVVLVAALVRLVRGGKAQTGSAAAMPAHGMIGLVSGLFAKKGHDETPAAHDNNEPKSH
jgi:ATP-dependent Zn protease